MARLNITIPDPLYERLKRLEDRVNASKVSAMAIEKELDTIESRPAVADPDIQKLIGRLQSTADKWRDRGKQDGRTWAIERATREELRSVYMLWRKSSTPHDCFSANERLSDWLTKDTKAKMEVWDRDHPEEPEEDEVAVKQTRSVHGRTYTRVVAEAEIRRAEQDNADRGAYAKGWSDAVCEVWQLVEQSLQA